SGVARVADQPVGARVDDAVVRLYDDRELEETAELVDGPSAEGESHPLDAEPECNRPPTRARQHEVARVRRGHAEPDAGEQCERQQDDTAVAIGPSPARANREHELEHRPGDDSQPDEGHGRRVVYSQRLHWEQAAKTEQSG